MERAQRRECIGDSEGIKEPDAREVASSVLEWVKIWKMDGAWAWGPGGLGEVWRGGYGCKCLASH